MLDYSVLNRIKCEDVSEFGKSIFKEEYLSAHSLVEEIMYINKKGQKDIDDFCNGNQVANIVSFLGERGMGKSSAMLSFAYYLKRYNLRDYDKEDPFIILNGKCNCHFYVLPKIDAVMLGENESLFDIVLAEMWDAFADRANKMKMSDNMYRTTRDRFGMVKRDYSRYWKRISEKEKIKGESSLDELHNLSQSINLRNSYFSLVEDYLQAMLPDDNDRYLVIPVDDLDLIEGDSYGKIDQLRMIFTIPKVIVLVTADVNRLSLDLAGEFSRELLSEINVKKNEKEKVREYADNYLAKILPRNMRIYMPLFNGIDGKKLEIFLDDQDLQNIFVNGAPKDKEKVTFERLMLSLVARDMGIVMFPNTNVHSVKQKSLRNIVNGTNELIKISKKKENYQEMYQWVLKELQISSREIKKNNLASFLQQLMHVSGNMFNYYLVNSRLNKGHGEIVRAFGPHNSYIYKVDDLLDESPGYGSVLREIIDCEMNYFQDSELSRQLTWLYSLQIGNSYIEREKNENKNDIEELFIRGDIFYSALRNYIINFERDRNSSSFLSMKLESRQDKAKGFDIIKDNKKKLADAFKVLLMFDIKKVLENATAECNEIQKEGDNQVRIYDFKVNTSPAKASIDNFFYNMVKLEEIWNLYLQWLIKNIVKGKKKPEIADVSATLAVAGGIKIDKYGSWKNEYGINSIIDVIPPSDVGIWVETVKRMRKIYKNRDLVFPGNYIIDFVKIMKEVRERSESYCCFKEMGIDRLNCCEMWESMVGLVDLENIDRSIIDNISIPVKNMEDTSV